MYSTGELLSKHTKNPGQSIRVTLAAIHLTLPGRYVMRRNPVRKLGILMTWTRAAKAEATSAVRLRTKKRTGNKKLMPGGNGGLSCVRYLHDISGGFGNCAR